MAKYRKKPIVIEAFKYDGKYDFLEIPNIPEWAISSFDIGDIFYGCGMDDNGEYLEDLFIKTLEGIHCVSKGDYIIKGVKGELYPCKPDIFEQTYEEVF